MSDLGPLWKVLLEYAFCDHDEWREEFRAWCEAHPRRYVPFPEDRNAAIREKYVSRRLELAAEIDRLFRTGAKWPKMYGPSRGREWWYWRPSAQGVVREQTLRPERGLCMLWNGAFWIPCLTMTERRQNGYVDLEVGRPVPVIGEFILRGRRAYCVREAESLAAGRSRVWCDRVPLLSIDPRRIRKEAAKIGEPVREIIAPTNLPMPGYPQPTPLPTEVPA